MDPAEPTRSAGPDPDQTTGGLTGWLGLAPEPDRVAGYRVEGKLGQGGMGVVFRAYHPDLKRPAAVKLLLAGRHAHDRDRVRFLAEAEAMAAVRHPHVATVYDFGTADDGQPYLAMEYLDGGSLHAKLGDAGTLPAAAAVDLVAKIADGVQAAHDCGIVHRDLKPGNVLLDAAGEPKVTDFGLAKRGDHDTASHAVMGTVGYMAPEQARGQTKRAGPAADVYALGAVLFRCLAGRPPFVGDNPAETLLRVIDEEAPSVSSVTAGIPRDLALIVAKCLEKEPGRRYPTAAALAADLRRFRAGEPVAARPVRAPERVLKWARRRPYLAGLSLALAVALVAGTAVSTALAVWALEQKKLAEAAAVAARDAQTLAEQREQQATAEVARAAAVSDALASVFRSSDPIDIFGDGLVPPKWEQQRNRTAEQLLREATARFRDALPGQPVARGRLLGTAAVSFRNLGLLADARPLQLESLTLLRQNLPTDHPDVAEAEYQLGRLEIEAGDYATADASLQAAVARLTRAGLPERRILHARMFAGIVQALRGREEGLAALAGVVADRARLDGPASEQALIARMALVAMQLELGRMSEALLALPGILDDLSKLPPSQTRDLGQIMAGFQSGVALAATATQLPAALRGTTLTAAANRIAEIDAALDTAMPERNIFRAIVRFTRADLYYELDKWADGDAQLTECLADVRATCGLAHPKALVPIRRWAQRLNASKRADEADALFAEAEAAIDARYGPGSGQLAVLLFVRTESQGAGRRPDDAVATAARALALADKVHPSREHAWPALHAAQAVRNLSDGREVALGLFTQARRLAAGSSGAESEVGAQVRREVADALRAAGHHREAEAALAELAKRAGGAADHRNITLVYRARLECDRGAWAAAEGLYRQAAALSKGLTGQQASYHAEDLRDLAGTLADQGRLPEAKAELEKALKAAQPNQRADIRYRLTAVRRALGERVPPDPRPTLGAAVGGLAAKPPPRPSRDAGFAYFDTDWLDRLPGR